MPDSVAWMDHSRRGPGKYTGEDRTDPVKKAETLWFGKNQELRGIKGLGNDQDSPWRTVPHRKCIPTS